MISSDLPALLTRHYYREEERHASRLVNRCVNDGHMNKRVVLYGKVVSKSHFESLVKQNDMLLAEFPVLWTEEEEQYVKEVMKIMDE